MRIFICVFATLVLASCASKPPTESRPESPAIPSDDGERGVDLVSLQRSLGLERSADELGFAEAAFQTCQAGYGFSSTKNCERQFLTVIQYRLQCREAEGTISYALTESDLRSISGRRITWTLGSQRGTTILDSRGQGKILAAFRNSAKTQRLKLSNGDDFMYLRAGEIKRVVTPPGWCN